MIPALPCGGFGCRCPSFSRPDLNNPHTARVWDFRFLCKAKPRFARSTADAKPLREAINQASRDADAFRSREGLVARATLCRSRALVPNIKIAASASQGLNATLRSNPQIRNRESNFW